MWYIQKLTSTLRVDPSKTKTAKVMQSNPERIGIKTHSMRILFHSSTDVTDIRIKYSLVIIWFHEYPDISMVGMQTLPSTKKK
jgi:hypothetical protein